MGRGRSLRGKKGLPRRLALAGVTGCLLLIALGCSPALGSPAIDQPAAASSVFDDSDPAVLVDGTNFYLFGSSNNMKVPVRQITSFTASLATSQTDWAQHPHDAMPTRPAWVNTADTAIWAPTVAKLGSTYVMWFAGHRTGATDVGNDQCIGRATSDTPMGPYTPDSAPIYCGLPPEAGSNPWGRGALDPSEITDPNTGNIYLLVALSRTQDNIGAIQLDSSGNVPGGINATATVLASVKFPWHDGVDDGTLNSPAFLENPSMIYEPNTKTFLLFYSAGQWNTSHYLTGFGRCATPTGPCTLDSRGPFLQGGNGRSGPGGLTTFTHPNTGALRVAYSSWTSGFEAQTGPVGQYSRQVSWGTLTVTATADPSAQSISLS